VTDGTPAFWRPGPFIHVPYPDSSSGLPDFDGYLAATVCRRGHTVEGTLHHDPGDDLGFCHDCVARIMSRCEQCGLRIRGQHTTRGGELVN
jgi:hypothetical protein